MAKKCPTCGTRMKKYVKVNKDGKEHISYYCPNLKCGLEEKPPERKEDDNKPTRRG